MKTRKSFQKENFRASNTSVTMILMTLAMGSMTACGGQAYRQESAANNGSVPGSISQPNLGGGSNSGGIPTTPNLPGSTNNFLPAATDSFSITGSGGNATTYQSAEIHTDNIFKVRITAGQAGPLNVSNDDPNAGNYSNYSASYGCVRYNVTVAGKTVTTQTLSVGNSSSALCADAPRSQVLDFSDRLGPGHGPIRVQVTAAGYDYYCQLVMMGAIHYAYYNTYCSASLYPVYRNHTATGSLEFQTNGSTL